MDDTQYTGGSVSARDGKVLVSLRPESEGSEPVEMELEVFQAMLMTWGVFKAATEIVGENGVQTIVQHLQMMETSQYDSTKVH